MTNAQKLHESSRGLVFMAALVAAGALVLPSRAANSLPWTDDFETGYIENTPLNGGAKGWTASDTGVKAQSGVKHLGAFAAFIPSEAGVTNLFSGAPQKVWIDMYVRPTLQSLYAPGDPTVDATATAFFFFQSNGFARVRNGSLWENKTGNPVNGSQFYRVTVFENHTTDKWALFINGVMVADQLVFANPGAGFTSLAVRNGAYLDNVFVSTYFPQAGDLNGVLSTDDADADSSADVWELHYFGNKLTYGAGADPDGDGRFNEEEWATSTDPTSASSVAWTIPYLQTFETAVQGISSSWHGITKSGAGQASIVASTEMQGSRVLNISTATVSFALSTLNANNTNVWCQIYAKPGVYYDGGGSPTLGADTVCGFYVRRSDGALMVYSNTIWQQATLLPTVPTNKWLGFAVHLDYSPNPTTGRKWELYVSTNGTYGALMKRVHTGSLAFNSSAVNTSFSGIQIETELPAYLDALAVSPGFDGTADSLDANLVVHERFANATKYISRPPYAYSDADSKLNGLVGTHLKRGLKTGGNAAPLPLADNLKVLTDEWQSYYVNTLSTWNVATVGSAPTSEMVITNTAGLSLARRPGTDFVVFYPHTNTDTNQAFSGNIHGSGTVNGWNVLSLPPSFRPRLVNGAPDGGPGFPGGTNYTDYVQAAAGDEIRIFEGGRRLYFNVLSKKWMEKGSVADATLHPGIGFLLRRKDGTDVTWAPTDN